MLASYDQFAVIHTTVIIIQVLVNVNTFGL